MGLFGFLQVPNQKAIIPARQKMLIIDAQIERIDPKLMHLRKILQVTQGQPFIIDP